LSTQFERKKRNKTFFEGIDSPQSPLHPRNIKRLEATYSFLFEDLVIIYGKMVRRIVEPGASFFGDIGSGFDGDVVVLGKVADGDDNRSVHIVGGVCGRAISGLGKVAHQSKNSNYLLL
jgi:hypothetical protein